MDRDCHPFVILFSLSCHSPVTFWQGLQQIDGGDQGKSPSFEVNLQIALMNEHLVVYTLTQQA
jgi:hypothetical protein